MIAILTSFMVRICAGTGRICAGRVQIRAGFSRRWLLAAFACLPLSGALAFFDSDPSASAFASQRDLYKQALRAARKGDWKQFDLTLFLR